MELLIQIGIVSGLLVLGIIAGGWHERRHRRLLEKRETGMRHIRVDNRKCIPDPDTVQQTSLVTGQVVIATDYFKTFTASLRNLVGGEMKSIQSLLMRARREALVRMLEQARTMGATEVWNVRFEFCNISQMSRRTGTAQVEMLAYGTAVVRRA